MTHLRSVGQASCANSRTSSPRPSPPRGRGGEGERRFGAREGGLWTSGPTQGRYVHSPTIAFFPCRRGGQRNDGVRLPLVVDSGTMAFVSPSWWTAGRWRSSPAVVVDSGTMAFVSPSWWTAERWRSSPPRGGQLDDPASPSPGQLDDRAFLPVVVDSWTIALFSPSWWTAGRSRFSPRRGERDDRAFSPSPPRPRGGEGRGEEVRIFRGGPALRGYFGALPTCSWRMSRTAPRAALVAISA